MRDTAGSVGGRPVDRADDRAGGPGRGALGGTGGGQSRPNRPRIAGESAEAASAPRPEASLEKDGGGCAPPASPRRRRRRAGGSCGGGGGAAPEEKQEEPPDVSGQDRRPPSVRSASWRRTRRLPPCPVWTPRRTRRSARSSSRLDADPPKRERPSGAPQTRSGTARGGPAGRPGHRQGREAGPEDRVGKQKAKGSEKAEGAKPTDNTPPPPPPWRTS